MRLHRARNRLNATRSRRGYLDRHCSKILRTVMNKARRDSWVSDVAYSEGGSFCFKEAAGRVS
jgi:hypothetical protein